MVVSVIVSGLPRHISLSKLGSEFDRIFDTNEIGSFRVRQLEDVRHGRQVALDFKSGFDAMIVQNILDRQDFNLEGNLYCFLRARIHKEPTKKVSSSEGMEIVSSSSSYRRDLGAMMSNVSPEDFVNASNKLDSQLILLQKQKKVLQAERELLMEKKKLEREYKSMNNDSEEFKKSPKRQRKRSRSPSPSTSYHARSRSGNYKRDSRNNISPECLDRQRSFCQVQSRSRYDRYGEMHKNYPDDRYRENDKRSPSTRRSRSPRQRRPISPKIRRLHSPENVTIETRKEYRSKSPKDFRPSPKEFRSSSKESKSPSKDLRSKLQKYSRSKSPQESRSRSPKDLRSKLVKRSRSKSPKDLRSKLIKVLRSNSSKDLGSKPPQLGSKSPNATIAKSPSYFVNTTRIAKNSSLELNETYDDISSGDDSCIEIISSSSNSTPKMSKKKVENAKLCLEADNKISKPINPRILNVAKQQVLIELELLMRNEMFGCSTSRLPTIIEDTINHRFNSLPVHGGFTADEVFKLYRKEHSLENDKKLILKILNESKELQVIDYSKEVEANTVVKTEPLALVPVVDTPTPVPDSTMKNDLIWSALDEVFEQQGMKIEEITVDSTQNYGLTQDDNVAQKGLTPNNDSTQNEVQVEIEELTHNEVETNKEDMIQNLRASADDDVILLNNELTQKENVLTNKHDSKPKTAEEGNLPQNCALHNKDNMTENDDSAQKRVAALITESIMAAEKNNTSNEINENVKHTIEEAVTDKGKPQETPTNPQFGIPIKVLMRQMKNLLNKMVQDCKYIHQITSRVMHARLLEMMKGKAYTRACIIIKMYRDIYPRDKDEEFLKKLSADINEGKYELQIMQLELKGVWS